MKEQLLDLLDQRPKNRTNWQCTIASGKALFDVLRKGPDTDWDLAERHLGSFITEFINDQQFDEECDRSTEIAQWIHASKLFLSARFVFENREVVDDHLKSFEGRLAILGDLRRSTDEYSKSYCHPISFSENEIILFCSLFAHELICDSLTIPFATVSSSSATEGGSVNLLELTKVRSFGYVGRDPRYFPCAGRYIDEIHDDFQNAIRLAYKFNLRLSKNGLDGTEVGSYGFVWDVKSFSSDCTKATPLHGESIGLTAAVGIYHSLAGTIPDNRVIFSAKLLEGEDREPTGRFGKVDGIASKIKAAINTGEIDTFVIHHDNFTNGQEAKIRSLLAEANCFRVKVIDSDGHEIKTVE